ncbi:hypothetical protein [Actinomadura sp. 9N215]|uniref:hypothetical protein n=1 Tax=Actinomadura sp. 9N215 TaxID=3375150 RepID=UPI0037AD1A3E
MLAALPAGVLVTVIDLIAFGRTKAALPGARPSVNADVVDLALAEYAEFGARRIMFIAGFFAVAVLVFGALAWVVRRGAFRRPAAVLLAAGTLTAIYLVGLFLVFVRDPVHDFGTQHVERPDGGLAGVPWAMDTVSPGWYRPALAAVVIGAAVAAIAACVLLARSRGSSWIAGRGGVEISARGHRTSTSMLMAAPAVVVLYAAVNLAAITAAAHGGNEYVDEAAGISRGIMSAVTAILAVVTAGWTTIGIFLRHGRAWPVSMVAAGALLIVHLLVLWLAWDYQPLGSAAFADDQGEVRAAGEPSVLACAGPRLGRRPGRRVACRGAAQTGRRERETGRRKPGAGRRPWRDQQIAVSRYLRSRSLGRRHWTPRARRPSSYESFRDGAGADRGSRHRHRAFSLFGRRLAKPLRRWCYFDESALLSGPLSTMALLPNPPAPIVCRVQLGKLGSPGVFARNRDSPSIDLSPSAVAHSAAEKCEVPVPLKRWPPMGPPLVVASNVPAPPALYCALNDTVTDWPVAAWPLTSPLTRPSRHVPVAVMFCSDTRVMPGPTPLIPSQDPPTRERLSTRAVRTSSFTNPRSRCAVARTAHSTGAAMA